MKSKPNPDILGNLEIPDVFFRSQIGQKKKKKKRVTLQYKNMVRKSYYNSGMLK